MRRIEQHPDRIAQRRHQHFGTRDAVEIARDRLERVVCRDRRIVLMFDLLQHRIGLACRKRVSHKQQQRDVVRRRCARGCDHIRRARTYRRKTRHDLAAVALLGKRRRHLRHTLLVLALIDFDRVPSHGQRFADAQHAAVSEDGKHSVHEFVFLAVKRNVLRVQKTDDRLSDGDLDGFFHIFPSLFRDMYRVISPNARIADRRYGSCPTDCRVSA